MSGRFELYRVVNENMKSQGFIGGPIRDIE